MKELVKNVLLKVGAFFMAIFYFIGTLILSFGGCLFYLIFSALSVAIGLYLLGIVYGWIKNL
jgi:hypothetical protein